MPHDSDSFDVIILGSGIAGSILGAILARHGAKVLLVDAGVHPRFAVGESTIPRTLNVMRVLAERYELPELEAFISYEKSLTTIGPTMGKKEHFGFMLHKEGEEPNPDHTSQLGTSIPGLHTGHLFRQDTDSYLFHTAIKYGCVGLQAFRVAGVDLGKDEVTVVGQDDRRFTARYLVDASGFRSPIADQLGLRAGPDALDHHARSLFTHMIDVKPTDECLRMPKSAHPPLPWVNGTMHHCIERGWFWVIPFNNHEKSLNPLVSVGLTFDERRYPKPDDISPEEEFRSYVSRYPVLERVFADAKTVRPWVSTGRLQYTSTRTVGHRWCMMSHAAGFIDPLYSRGLTNTGEVIDAVAWRLLAAIDDNDFSEERFEHVERLQQGLIKYNDQLVNCSYISWSDWDLWNAVYRVWAVSQLPASMRSGRAVEKYLVDGDDRVFMELENDRFPGALFPDNETYDELFGEMVALCGAVDRGERTASDAGADLMKRFLSSPIVGPHLGLEDPEFRFIDPTPDSFLRYARWIATEAPDDLRYLADNPKFARMTQAARAADAR